MYLYEGTFLFFCISFYVVQHLFANIELRFDAVEAKISLHYVLWKLRLFIF